MGWDFQSNFDLFKGPNHMRTTGMKRALTGAAIAALAMTASAAHAASATATAKAKILAPLTILNTSDLDFGTIVSGTAASTVAVSTAGAATCGSGLTCIGKIGRAPCRERVCQYV